MYGASMKLKYNFLKIETGHLTLQILVCIGIILTMAFMTPFMVSAFAATRINRYNKEHHR